MNVGVVGLGKLGLVFAQTVRHRRGHQVIGYDVAPAEVVQQRLQDFPEPVHKGDLEFTSDLAHLVKWASVIFVCVDTPHTDPELDGTHLSTATADFDYTNLVAALCAVDKAAEKADVEHVPVVVVSTVSPGTFANTVEPVISERLHLAYSPSFISLGTIERDLLNPAAVLIGANDVALGSLVGSLNPAHNDVPRVVVNIAEAEMVKMTSNVLQTMKIQYINSLVPLADHVGADIDNVTQCLRMILNHGWVPDAGMPDGGACRPRDLVAMEHVYTETLGREWVNPFTGTRALRDDQVIRIAADVIDLAVANDDLPIVILGTPYKAGVPYTDGSPGVFLFNVLADADPDIELTLTDIGDHVVLDETAIYVCAHPTQRTQWPTDSVVYDVWGSAGAGEGVTLIRPGRNRV